MEKDMLFSSWLRNWKRSTTSACRRTQTSSRQRARFRPRLESIEDRTLLSTYVVDSLTDTGAGSGLSGDLRYCMINATSGSDTITFAQGLTGTINLESDLPALNARVDIQGPGADKLTVALSTSGYETQMISVGNAANVQISGLTFSAGGGGFGAIANAGTLTLSACTFSSFYDAPLVSNTGTTMMSDCTLASNPYFEPSLTNFNAMTISDCSLSNVSIQNDGWLAPPAATLAVSNTTLSGSPIDNYGGSATVSYCTISGCTSTGISNQNAGSTGNMTISNCTIEDNAAVGNVVYESSTAGGSGGVVPAGSGLGGGIYVGSGTLSINSCTIADNEAIGGSDPEGYTTGNGYGGGLYIAGGTVAINNSTLADNQALGGYAGGVTMFNSSSGIMNNGQAGCGYGGGLYLTGGNVSINNSTLADNQALAGTAGLSSYPGVGNGGGIDNIAGPGALTMYDTILADNIANTAGPDLDGSVTSLGKNLIGNSTGGSGFAASDLLNVNPLLGPLQNNGGPTETMELLPDSPAFNAGNNTNAPVYDQRGPGYARIVGGTIDIGAFEFQSTVNPASSFKLTGFPSVVTAGSTDTFTVTALNANGTVATDYDGTVQFTSSDGQAGLPAAYTFSAANGGVHTFTATVKTAGTQSLTVTDVTFGTQGVETGIDVNSAAASYLAVNAPTSATAGSSFSVTVTAFDPYNNIATGYRGTIHFISIDFSGTDSQFSLPANYTFTAADAGVHTFKGVTFKTAGLQSVDVMDTANSAILGSTVLAVSPAAASRLLVNGFPSTATAGDGQYVTVTVEDAYGNTVTGYTGTVHFASSDHQATLPANYTFTAADAGSQFFMVTLKTAGMQWIAAVDTTNVNLIDTDGSIRVTPAAASRFNIKTPSSVQPGVAFSLTLTVDDAYGNIVTGYTGTVHFSSSDKTATLPANYKFTAANKGVHTFAGVVLRKKGNQQITITDTQNSSLTGSVTVDVH
jgi:hypothetical protein